MTLLEKFLLVACALLLGFAAYIFWLNRADTALRAKIFSALLVGAAAAAAAGVFSLKAEKQEVSFSSVFVFNTKTNMPLNSYRDDRVNPLASCPNASLAAAILTQVDKARKTKGDVRNSRSEPNSYYDLLTLLIIEDMHLLYSEGWEIELTRFDSELFGRGVKRHAKPSPGATAISRKDFVSLFDRPEFLEALPMLFDELKLPPGTKMRLKKDAFCREIVLTNAYATVRITVTQGWGLPGLGVLSRWVTIPEEEQKEYMWAIFKVNMSAEYAYLRSGHPDMPVYKNWVKTMTEYLRSDLGCAAWEEQLKPHARDYMPEGT